MGWVVQWNGMRQAGKGWIEPHRIGAERSGSDRMDMFGWGGLGYDK